MTEIEGKETHVNESNIRDKSVIVLMIEQERNRVLNKSINTK